MADALHDLSFRSSRGELMPRKTAKQIVDEVVAKVKEAEAPKIEEPKKEHYYRCMTIVAPGSACNCYVGE